jgi:hypothetical protein
VALLLLCGGVVLVVAARRDLMPAPDPVQVIAPAATSTSEAPPDAGSSPWPGDAGDDDDTQASCAIADRGFGSYGPWQSLPQGRMLAPATPPTGEYDLLLHFHGAEAARKVLATADLGNDDKVPLVIAGVDSGVGSAAYAEAFYGAEPLQDLLGTVGAALAPARLRYLFVSSWSAGYGAVREILTQHPTVPNAVILLDSVHSAYEADGKTLVKASLNPFVALAERAIANEAILVLTHSEIRPPGYASTAEVAGFLLDQVGGRRRYAGLLGSHGVENKTRFDRGQLHVRGYTGAGKPAHCAHIEMLPDILKTEVLPAMPDE